MVEQEQVRPMVVTELGDSHAHLQATSRIQPLGFENSPLFREIRRRIQDERRLIEGDLPLRRIGEILFEVGLKVPKIQTLETP